MKTKKIQKWVPDTKIARKLHSVLEEQPGKIKIEVEVLDDSFGVEDLIKAINNLTINQGSTPSKIILNPKNYNQLLEDASFKTTYPGNTDSSGKLTIHGVEVEYSNWVGVDRILVKK